MTQYFYLVLVKYINLTLKTIHNLTLKTKHNLDSLEDEAPQPGTWHRRDTARSSPLRDITRPRHPHHKGGRRLEGKGWLSNILG